jgi:hypothetical protein
MGKTMSNDVRNTIELHGGGPLTTEEVLRAVHGEDADLVEVNDGYYKIVLEESGRIKFWTKNAPPDGAIERPGLPEAFASDDGILFR